jgi:hypothetical protein
VDHRRRNVWLTGLIVTTLMVLFPPWLYLDTYTSNQRSAGYHFLFSRPPVKTYEEMFGFVPSDRMPTQYARVSLNGVRLLTQLLTILFLTAGIGLRLRGNSSWSSGCFMALGISSVVLLILLMSLHY